VAWLRKRCGVYYVCWSEGGKKHRKSLFTESHQLAKDKLRQFESARARGEDNTLLTRTLIDEIVQAFAEHVWLHQREKSAQTEIYYLREAFGEICPALERRVGPNCGWDEFTRYRIEVTHNERTGSTQIVV